MCIDSMIRFHLLLIIRPCLLGLTDTELQTQIACSDAMRSPADLQAAALQEYSQSRQEMQVQSRLHGSMAEQWSVARRATKRGPPSTPAASSAATPRGELADSDAKMTDGPASSTDRPLFNPVAMDTDSAYQLTAAEYGVDINNQAAMKTWMGAPIPNRAELLATLRAYHTAVIRPELYNLIAQVEAAFQCMDDRLFQQSRELHWMAAENRQSQKAQSALTVITSGWDPSMSPDDRLYQLNWMISQVDSIRSFLQMRGLLGTDQSYAGHHFLNVLATDPVTVPNPQGYSTMTTLLFKSWDTRQAFMSKFGGQTGVPLWRDSQTAVTGKHIRTTPSSPQYQRKLELPLRVILDIINTAPALQGQQVVILWKTLTIMQPQVRSQFDSQAEAFCRLRYEEQQGTVVGILEVTQELMEIMNSSAGDGPQTCWHKSWNKIVWGTQYELDQADKQLLERGNVKGGGKGKHWALPLIYSSYHTPYPLDLKVEQSQEIAFVWDEYCDKTGASTEKVGNYKQATVKGKPAVQAAKAAPPSLAGSAVNSTAGRR